MKNISKLVIAHKHHIIAALVLSLAIFVALTVGNKMGVGGITIQPWLLLSGLLVAEMGRSLTCFGQKLKRGWLEYLGVFTQGLAWWIWSLNLPFLQGKHGFTLVMHMVCPALLLGALPMVAHYATRMSLEAMGAYPCENEQGCSKKESDGGRHL